MIKKLRLKFILFSALSTFLVLFFIIGTLNVVVHIQTINEIQDTLHYIDDNDGNFPDFRPEPGEDHEPRPETRVRVRFFVSEISEDGSITLTNMSQINLGENDAIEYVRKAISAQKDFGRENIFYYLRTSLDSGNTRYIFMECGYQIDYRSNIFLYSTLISGSAFTLVVFVTSLLSKKAIKPFEDSMQNEKRFITDASHELKTPLSIIHANAEVLALENPENEWIDSTLKQTKRLTNLVNNLVLLTKLDENAASLTTNKFNISEELMEVASSFKTLANKKHINYVLNIPENIFYSGDVESFEKVFSILLDNALKYTPSKGTICVELKVERKTIIINFKNTNPGIDQETLNHVFDRFYRAENSRSRKTGGFGIGLSIAFSVIEAHKGTLKASLDDDLVSFKIKLKQN